MQTEKCSIPVSDKPGAVSGLFLRPEVARGVMALGHGAGAGMAHPFMEGLAQALAGMGIATLRYQFLYMEQQKKRPDRPEEARQAVWAALERARALAPGLPLLAGGKS